MNSTDRHELRKRLLANGYRPLPLLDKGIRIKGWSTLTVDDEWLEQFARSGRYQNTGIRCDDLIAFDIDVLDGAIADDIEESIEDLCGPTDLCRVGRWPKRLLLYRLVGEPIRSARTGKYDGHQVELLTSSGRQFAAFGMHPGTEKDYEWHDDDQGNLFSPLTVPFDQLPELDSAKAQQMMEAIEVIFESHGLTQDSPGNTLGTSGDIIYDLKYESEFEWGGVPFQWGDLKGHLTEAGMWCNMMRENGEFGDSEGVHAYLAKGSGVPTVHDFPRDTTHQESFQVPDAAAAAFAPPEDDKTVLDDMLDKWVLLNDQTMRRVNDPLRDYTVTGMKLRMKAITVEITSAAGNVKNIPVVDMWIANPRKLAADYFQMRPDWPDTILINQGEVTVFNTYRRPKHEPLFQGKGGDLETFMEFINHLIPSPIERDLFLDWLALKVRYPSLRMHGLIMVTKEFGTGRGTLFQIVEKLFGIQYVKNMDYDDLIGHTSQSTYNDYFADSLVVTVGEVFEKTDHKSDWEARKIAYERLKSICEPTARPMHIKRKYGRNSTEMVYASLLVSSNHDDALAIEPGDRRMVVLDNTRVALWDAPNQLFDRIHAWKENPANIARLYTMLNERADRATYDPIGEPPLTPAKKRMIDSGQSDVDLLYEEFVEQCKGDVCVHYQWEMFARRQQLAGSYDVPHGEKFGKAVTAVISKKATRFDHLGNKQIKIDGQPQRPWILRNFSDWKSNGLNAEIRDEIEKNGNTKADVSPLIPQV